MYLIVCELYFTALGSSVWLVDIHITPKNYQVSIFDQVVLYVVICARKTSLTAKASPIKSPQV